jgi:hypothetical protein
MNKFGYILIVYLLYYPILLLSQTATEEALDKACDCFNAIDFLSIEYNKISVVGDSCIQNALYTNLTGVFKENNTTLDDNDAMFKLAQIIHTSLTIQCDGFKKFSKRIAQRRVEEVKEKNPSSTGLLFNLNTDHQFPIITIITKDHQAFEFIWFQEFDGSTRFMEGIKMHKNTIVEIVWKDLELYDAINKKYPFYKEIILIEELRTIENKERKAWIKSYKGTLKPKSKKKK